MDKVPRWPAALWAAAILAAAPPARAQRAPDTGYVFPAGGRQGSVVEVAIGGQYLDGVTEVLVSGEGVRAALVKLAKPMSPKQINEVRQKLQEARKRIQAARAGGKRLSAAEEAQAFRKIAQELGVTAEALKEFMELRRKLADPKRQPNPQIAETVIAKVTVAPDAEGGQRELRLKTPSGLTKPLYFQVGQCPEYSEKEPNDLAPDGGIPESLPVTLNGQILPGDVDRFRFKAPKGTRLVAAVSAQRLMPYLADAVPGWFQATLTLFDAEGNELAFADDFRFHPDPVMYCELPRDGEYVLEIKDAIYRGREDFVYRITLGEVPFVTGVFPLGGRAGGKTTVALQGWNLPADSLTVDAAGKGPGVLPVFVRKGDHVSNRLPFALDTLPECLAAEPNDDRSAAQPVKLPVIVNGRIERPGDWDVFRFAGRAGDEIVAEVQARRLESPLDSLLKLTDAAGKQLAANDDHEDKGAGLTTHQADSRLILRLPADGTYFLHLGDTQHKAGPAYAYRLRISTPRPDFSLLVAPATLNVRPGLTVPITVYALRKDGFSGRIALRLKDMPPGFALGGGSMPAGVDTLRVTLTVAPTAPEGPVSLGLAGHAVIAGREVARTAVAVEDMMQAFLYRHLVPVTDGKVAVAGPRRWVPPLKLLGEEPVKLPAGAAARLRWSGPRVARVLDRLELELDNPPDGIAIQDVSRGPRGLDVLLSVDGAKAKPGLRGNLILNAFMLGPTTTKDGKPVARRWRGPLGALPAVSFEVVAPSAPTPSAPDRRRAARKESPSRR